MNAVHQLELPKSLWRDTAEGLPPIKPFEGVMRTEIVIIGGGFTGMRAALELATNGRSVAVLEAGDIGWGASGRSGGQVNPIMRLTSDSLIKLIGQDFAKKLITATIKSADEVFNLIKNYGIKCDAVQNGWLQVAHCESADRNLLTLADDWRSYGATIEHLRGTALQERTGTTIYAAGLRHSKAGHLHPLSYVRGLARAALNAGASIYTHSSAQHIALQNEKWTIQVNGGKIEADTILLCTNGYTKGLNKPLDNSYLPFTPIQLATSPLEPHVYNSILPNSETIADTRRLIFYGRKTADHRLVFGGLGKGINNHKDYQRIKREAIRLFPILKNISWDYQWGGNIAMTMDSIPHIHKLAPGLFAALGCNGRGVAMATVMGRVLSEYVTEERNTYDLPLTAVPHINFRQIKSFSIPYSLPILGWLDRKDH